MKGNIFQQSIGLLIVFSLMLGLMVIGCNTDKPGSDAQAITGTNDVNVKPPSLTINSINYYYYTPKGTKLNAVLGANPNCHSFAWQGINALPVTEYDMPNPSYYLATPKPFVDDGSFKLVGTSRVSDANAPAGTMVGDKVVFGNNQNDYQFSAVVECNANSPAYVMGYIPDPDPNKEKIAVTQHPSKFGINATYLYFYHVSDERYTRTPMQPRIKINFKSYYNGKYVCADFYDNKGGPPINTNAPLWSNRNNPAEWETFYLVNPCDGSSNVWLYSFGNCCYVQASATARATANAYPAGTANTTFTLVFDGNRNDMDCWHFISKVNNGLLRYDSFQSIITNPGPGTWFHVNFY